MCKVRDDANWKRTGTKRTNSAGYLWISDVGLCKTNMLRDALNQTGRSVLTGTFTSASSAGTGSAAFARVCFDVDGDPDS